MHPSFASKSTGPRAVGRLRAAVALASALLLVPAVAAAAPTGIPARTGEAGVVIVRFADGTDARAEAARAARAGASVQHVYTHVFPGFAARLSDGARDALLSNPRVVSVEADGVVTTTSTAGVQSNPTWGLDRVDQVNRPLDSTYAYPSTGAGVRAYIVDTGVLANHTDFGGRVIGGYTAISDGNGTSDCNGHGTHVAGTVAGARWGVAKAATIVPVRVLSCSGSGSTSGVIAGMDWIVANHPKGTPGVANLSLGGGASSTMDAAVGRVHAAGVTVVVAAGNSSADACTSSPARAPEAITVGSTTSSDARSSFSNFGTCLDLFAPGSSITSAWYTSTTATSTISGTSMAAPHVAGAAVLVLALGRGSTPQQVTNVLVADATPGLVTSAGTGSPNLLLRVVGGAAAPPVALVAPEVASITNTQGGGRWSSATAQVKVVDEDATSVPLAGVTVEGRWYVGGSAQSGTVTAQTGSDGVASFSSPTYKVRSTEVTLRVSKLSGSTIETRTYTPELSADDLTEPPVSEPPAEEPPADEPPADEPPADEPPADEPPADEPPADEPAPSILLTATGTKVKADRFVDLAWSGLTGPYSVWRNGTQIASSVSGTSYRDALGRSSGTFTYRVCLTADPSVCSADVSVTF
jgi:subtilisin family serine protease